MKQFKSKRWYEERILTLQEEIRFQQKKTKDAQTLAEGAAEEMSSVIDAILGEIVTKYGPIEIPIPNVKKGLKVQVERDNDAGTYKISLISPEEAPGDGEE